MTATHRKRPVEIEARQVTRENASDIAAWCGGRVIQTAKPGDPDDIYVALEIPTLEGIMLVLLDAGYSKGPRPITDEMVEAAAREYHERGNGEGSYARASEHVRTSLLFRMKCAFNAAEAVGS